MQEVFGRYNLTQKVLYFVPFFVDGFGFWEGSERIEPAIEEDSTWGFAGELCGHGVDEFGPERYLCHG